jgi:hypothetical protein
VNLFNEPSRCRPNDIPVLCGAGLRGDPPQDAALAVVYVPTRSEDQAELRYSITGTKRLQNLDLASSASLDSDGVDARKLITSAVMRTRAGSNSRTSQRSRDRSLI